MSDDMMPEGLLVQVEMTVRVPIAATWEQIEQWLSLEITNSGSCPSDNPLLKHSAEEWSSTFQIDSDGLVGFREEYDSEEMPNGGRRYRVRYREVRP